VPNSLVSSKAPDFSDSDRRSVRSSSYGHQSRVSPLNIDDRSTSFVFDRLFDTTAERVGMPEAQLGGAGSILQNTRSQRSSHTCHIVGSDYVLPQMHRPVPPQLTVHSVRGYLTRETLDMERKSTISVGDPRMLVSGIAPKRPHRPKFSYGIIPHISALAAGEWKNSNALLPNSTTIDLGATAVEAFLGAMQDCEIIISQSLHGLIFADALGIPNAWLGDWDTSVRGGADFKFFDYFSAIGRPAHLIAARASALSETAVLRSLYEPDGMRIRPVQAHVIAAFDCALKEIAIYADSKLAGQAAHVV
jgi:pyruvyltransferase